MLSCRDGVQSEEVAKLNTGKDAAYRLLLHPSGRALVCGMSVGGLERVDLQPSSGGEPPRLSLSQGARPKLQRSMAVGWQGGQGGVQRAASPAWGATCCLRAPCPAQR